MNVVQVDTESFDATVYTPRDHLVVVYFWGHDCPNCELFAKRLPHLEKALAGAPITLVKINVYEHSTIAHRFGLYGIPAFLLVRDGKQIGMMRQFHGDAYWLAVIREHTPSSAGATETTTRGD